MIRTLALFIGATLLATNFGQSNIAPEHALAWGENIGWIHWRGDNQSGAKAGRSIVSGFIHSANAGWIHLGNGLPRNGIAYQNDSAEDFGLNLDSRGNLTGLAYGANIGWITASQARVDLMTGKLSGFLYSANAGWISLAGDNFYVAVETIDPGADADRDFIPDSFELSITGNLTTLSAGNDADGDGQADQDEYLAGTDPLKAAELFEAWLSVTPAGMHLQWTSSENRVYSVQSRATLSPATPWENIQVEPVIEASGILGITLINPDPTKRFFRIVASFPLSPR